MRSSTLIVFSLAYSAALAQTSSPPAFEAASIRPDPDRIGSIQDDPGMLTMRGINLRACIEWAYDVQAFQISGPPSLGDSRFAITAKAADAADSHRLRLVLRSLLAERFGLKLHGEQKELPVYSLIVAPNGPRFHDTRQKDASRFLESTGDGRNVSARIRQD